jgi:transcription initiation factor TFIID subunit TAF12
MNIKELLEALSKGEKTIDEVVTAINESQKDTVPYSRFNEKVQEVNTLKKDLKERDNQLESLNKSAGDNQTLKDDIAKLQKQNEDAKAEYEAQIASLQLNAALDNSLLAAKVRNPQIVKGALNMDTIKLDNGQLLGLSEQLEKLQESDGYLFDIADSSQQQQQQQQQQRGAYGTGLTGRGNTPPPPPDKFEAGKQRALARHAARLPKEEN